MKMAPKTLDNIVVDRLQPTIKFPQNMCLDKAYDFPEVYELLQDYGYTAHIRSRGEEYNDKAKKKIPGYRARR
jgi:putative transposase